MDIETWLKIICPNCHKSNWLCNGDISDMTYPDIDGFTCYNCEKSYSIDGEEDIEDNECYEIGEEKP